jgi:predicted DNA-binding transcriptional regulator AlpA
MYLSDRQLGERFSVNRITIWRWARTDPTFPKPVKLTPGCSRWRLADIEIWEGQRATVAA